MNPQEFAKTIYLGDRYCRAVLIDRAKRRVSIHVDVLSRIRDQSGQWNYDTSEDIKDGVVVLDGMESCLLEPPDAIPNDWVEIVSVTSIQEESGKYQFCISLGCVDAKGNAREAVLSVSATGIHLEDPKQPGVEIST